MNLGRAGLVLLLTVLSTDAWAAPRVSFELVTETGFPLTGAQRWLEALKDLEDVDLRIRPGQADDQVEVTNRGTEASPRYHVVGVLTAENRLELPGGRFGLHDRAQIAKWLEKLREGGVEGLTAPKAAFGLTAKQLVEFHDRLTRPLAFKTKGIRAGDVARQIVRDAAVEFTVTEPARQAFARHELVLDELEGLSSGTALAATLRPLGLVFSPGKPRGGQVPLQISDVREVEEAWPIGWPPEDVPRNIAPKLYEYLTVEIAGTPLAEAIEAIRGRVGVHFLFDHNAIARQDIDLTKESVSFPRRRIQYQRVLDQVLAQGHLMSELRLDEAGIPFLWISPRRQ